MDIVGISDLILEFLSDKVKAKYILKPDITGPRLQVFFVSGKVDEQF